MHDKRKLLLRKAVENNGTLTTAMARQLYSPGQAKSAIASMEFQGFIERAAPGVFRVVAIPPEVRDQLPEELLEKLEEDTREKLEA